MFEVFGSFIRSLGVHLTDAETREQFLGRSLADCMKIVERFRGSPAPRGSLESYTAPAYAPDGTLYIRDQDGSAYIFAAGSKPRLVFKAEKDEAEPEEDDYGADDPMPVEFDAAGKPQFDVRVGPSGE